MTENLIFGMELVNVGDLSTMVVRFLFNFLMVFTIGRFIYYPLSRLKEYLFTFLLISNIVFLICYLLDNVEMELGLALGLFAIFGILRYRTNPIPIREMTYLFIVIGLSVINSLANKHISIAEIVFANAFVLFVTFGLERIWFLKHEQGRSITYEIIENIKLENYDILKEDLESRLGLVINRVEVGKIDFLNDTAQLKVYFFEEDQKIQFPNE